MRIGNVRLHLRHTGVERWQFKYTNLSKLWAGNSWGYNFTVGRWCLVLRRPSGLDIHRSFFDFGFGRSMLKAQRFYNSKEALAMPKNCPWCGAEKENPLGMCSICYRFPVTGNSTVMRRLIRKEAPNE